MKDALCFTESDVGGEGGGGDDGDGEVKVSMKRF